MYRKSPRRVYKHFRGDTILQTYPAGSTETLENIRQYTWSHVPEESNIDQQSFKNLNSREKMTVIYHVDDVRQVNTFQLQNSPEGHHLSLASTKCYLCKFCTDFEHTEKNSELY